MENELSYRRRLLHAQLDLLAFEQRRRRGEEHRPLADVLDEVLSDAGSRRPGHVTTGSVTSVPPTLADETVRGAPTDAQPLEDLPAEHQPSEDRPPGIGDFLARLASVSDAELGDIFSELTAAEQTVSAHRRTVHRAEAVLGDELRRRYREGLSTVDDLIPD